MSLICSKCGRDLNEIWQDNMSPVPGLVLCEDCSGFTAGQKGCRYCQDKSYKQKGYYVDDPEGEIVGINHYCMNCGKRLEEAIK